MSVKEKKLKEEVVSIDTPRDEKKEESIFVENSQASEKKDTVSENTKKEEVASVNTTKDAEKDTSVDNNKVKNDSRNTKKNKPKKDKFVSIDTANNAKNDETISVDTTKNKTKKETVSADTPKENNNSNSTAISNFEKASVPSGETVNVGHQILKLFQNLVFTFIAIVIIAFTIFSIMNIDNSTISSGVSILGYDVSKLDRETATQMVANYLEERLSNDIVLKHGDFETNIGPEQIETKVNLHSAIDAAFEVGSGKNIFSNSFKKLSLLITPVDIKPSISINNDQLEKTLNDISTQLPDAVKQSDYYIENKNLVITSGKAGSVINVPAMSNTIIKKINDLSYINTPIELVTETQEPKAPNIEQIYSEIHKEATDARFDANTRIVYPEENGLDFNISLDEAKQMLSVAQEEYVIPLKVLYPSVTTNMIGMEAFPELLSTFSTRYVASNVGRTTNLKLAAGKVNGTVLLPGQTFSYNGVVGERTIAAGYKEAAIYQDGEVVNGLGGGICQISTTLYNAALYANLEILERRNHQFVPSYIGAGRDATVVYGSQDFKFKNNRNYAIKITCSVERGVATFNIYGISEENDYEVVISSNITSRSANSFTSATYKTLKQNGEVVSSETISRDTYKTH